MKIKRGKYIKQFDIVSLIDVVFLLLIFGLVVASIMIGEGIGRNGGSVGKEALRITVSQSEPYVERSMVKISFPGRREDSLLFPSNDTLVMLSEYDFGGLDASKLIYKSIAEYNQSSAGRDVNTDTVVIVADGQTLFRIIGFIIHTCGGFDNLVPAVRTASLEEIKG